MSASELAAGRGIIDFCTLGMFIIDEIEFMPPTPPAKDIVGGAGAYSALGARLFSPPPESKRVGWIVDCGSDFPEELYRYIDGWNTSCLMRQTPDRLTTRGWNGYGENEHRAFKYMTPKLRLDHDAITKGGRLLWSKSYHLICSPLRCIDLVENILRIRQEVADAGGFSEARPLFIWEPVPDLCTLGEYDNCLKALRCIDVVSPNHGELGGFFGKDTNGNEHVEYRLIETLCDQWLENGIGKDGAGGIVVRCGRDGCLATRKGLRAWLPAYHQSSERVVDPTGGGNGFLGGLAVGLVRSGSSPGVEFLAEAAIWGSISASFAIEQIGMPVLHRTGEAETWNGVLVGDRLAEFKERLKGYIQP
ncbi:Ribokinase-like protein [Setomelanomma holmii]|uniref:Ribokinase-like protein n=1 Tax=Setomelanomma holmii TaxID=210430 RepID=A0A9P4LHX1_9PLEO|nr:Ribokinase-like protein [Setomelanomma holmii]